MSGAVFVDSALMYGGNSGWRHGMAPHVPWAKCQIALLSDDASGLSLQAQLPKSCRILALGRYRMLSIAQDSEVYAAAGRMAAAIIEDLKPELSLIWGRDAQDYTTEIEIALLHALVAPLRPLCEIEHILTREGLSAVLFSRAQARWQAILEAFLFWQRNHARRGLEPVPPMEGCAARGPRELALLVSDGRLRPSAQSGFSRLACAVEARQGCVIALAMPGRAGMVRMRNLRAVFAVRRAVFRVLGKGPLASYIMRPVLGCLAFRLGALLEVARRFRHWAGEGAPKALLATHAQRIPVTFALAGAHQGGAVTVDIRTMLSTAGPRYGVLARTAILVPDFGQEIVIAEGHRDGQGGCPLVKAVGSVELEARLAELAARPVAERRSVLLCAQPAAEDMAPIVALLRALPPDIPVEILPHPEDGALSRARWAALVEGRANTIIAVSGDEALGRAKVVITATSNMAVLATAMGINTVLVARKSDLAAIWGENGPFPGQLVEPDIPDIEERGLVALRSAYSTSPAEYAAFLERNAPLLTGETTTRIMNAVDSLAADP